MTPPDRKNPPRGPESGDRPVAPLSGAGFGPDLRAPALSGSTLGLGGTSSSAMTMDPRYQDSGLLGRGGMGEVRAAHDPILQRTVALKAPFRGDPRSSSRLMAEAVLTARLEHPGIPPIFDAGTQPDGRAWYTMPVIDGRTLAEELDDASTIEARLGLLRHVIDAVNAVAYAHSKGVLHRDLKPSNIMVGAFGRTMVMDWGVAGLVGGTAQAADGSSVGTPGFMPPEQERGEPMGPTADVYALGATLLALLRGPDVPEEALPPELLAIATRATHKAPADRYPDAFALGADLTAWSEGRRVTAYSYSLAELARRAWATSRGVILATAAAIVGVTVATAVGVERTAAQRDRATLAEQQAVAALARSEESLGVAQLAQALEALRDGDRSGAEVLAATVLTRLASPEARGVLAAFDPSTRPRLLQRWPMPGAREVRLAPDGRTVAFSAPVPGGDEGSVAWTVMAIAADGSTRLTPAPDMTSVRPFGSQGRSTARSGDEIRLVEADGSFRVIGRSSARAFNAPRNPLDDYVVWHGSGGPNVIELTTGRGWGVSPHCVAAATGAFPEVRAEGALIAACADGRVERISLAEGSQPTVLLRVADPTARAYTFSRSQAAGDPSVYFTPAGDAVVIDATTGAVLQTFPSGASSWLSDTHLGDRLVLRAADGLAHVFDWHDRVEVAAIPAGAGESALMDGGRRLRIVSDDVEDWALPDALPAAGRWPSPSGITAVDVSPGGLFWASSHGNGHVRIGRLDQPTLIADLVLSEAVIKDVAFSPDGTRLAVAFAGRAEVAVIDLAHPTEPRFLPAISGSRVVWLTSGLYLAPYSPGLLYWPEPVQGAGQPIGGVGQTVELEATRDRTSALVIPSEGPVRGVRDDLVPPQLIEVVGPPRVHAIGGDLHDIVGVSMGGFTRMIDGVEAAHGDGVLTTYLRMTMSRDGRRFALGRDDGGVEVWSTEPFVKLAVLRGHTQRVSGLAFDSTGQWLVSGSWDGEVRRWSLASLDADPTAQLAQIEADWGRMAADVLRSAP